MAEINSTPSMSGTLSTEQSMSGSLSNASGSMSGTVERTSIKVTDDYMNLQNKPQIEGVTLEGDKSFAELNLNFMTNIEMEEMLA